MLLRALKLSIASLGLLIAFTGCNTPTTPDAGLPPGTAFLADTEEKAFSEILQKDVRVVLQFELVDSVRPKQRLTLGQQKGYVVPAGERRVQFRVLLPSAGMMDSGAREARGFLDVTLVDGHRYRIAGSYAGNKRTFHLLDMTTNQPVSPEIDLGFFAPVHRGPDYIPIIIPIKT